MTAQERIIDKDNYGVSDAVIYAMHAFLLMIYSIWWRISDSNVSFFI